METRLTGYLNFDHNPNFLDVGKTGDLNDIKHIYFKILDTDQIKKLCNITKIYQNSDCFLPTRESDDGGILIKVSTQKLSKYLSMRLLNTDREKWNNQQFTIKFKVRKYEFKKIDNIIKGIQFVLYHLDFVI